MAIKQNLSGRRIAILATNGFEQTELTEPRDQLSDAGAKVTIVSPETGKIKGWNVDDWGDEIAVDQALEDTDAKDFDALVLPGGQINPDLLRIDDKAKALILDFDAAGKTIAAICHAPWLLAETGIAKGKKLTSYKSIRTDMANAGADVVDEQVVVDGNVITSRNPDDLDAFCAAIADALAKVETAA